MTDIGQVAMTAPMTETIDRGHNHLTDRETDRSQMTETGLEIQTTDLGANQMTGNHIPITKINTIGAIHATGTNQAEITIKQTEITIKQTEIIIKQTEIIIKRTEIIIEQTETTINQTEIVISQTETTIKQTETIVTTITPYPQVTIIHNNNRIITNSKINRTTHSVLFAMKTIDGDAMLYANTVAE